MFVRELSRGAGFSSQTVEQLISLSGPFARERNIEPAKRFRGVLFRSTSSCIHTARGIFLSTSSAFTVPSGVTSEKSRGIVRGIPSGTKHASCRRNPSVSLRNSAINFRGATNDFATVSDGRSWDYPVSLGDGGFDDEPLRCSSMPLDRQFVHWSKHRRAILFVQKTIDIALSSCCKCI